jgi:hypothetical protein
MRKQPVIFDVDGTLTSEHYDEDNLLTLRENAAMLLVAIALQAERPLLISTARPERLRPQTTEWLKMHGLLPIQIFMRPDDQEGVPDHVIKEDHLNRIRSFYGDPLVWVDDNSGVINMLKNNKIAVIAVAST